METDSQELSEIHGLGNTQMESQVQFVATNWEEA